MSFNLTGPTSITVNQGESASAIYRAVRLAKPYRNVSFSVTSLPPGITAAFIPVSCTPTCQVILTLTASLSLAPGIYTIQVIARDAKSSKSMSTSVFVVSRGQVNIPEIANWYVATNGSDAASGADITHPFLTIGKAVSVVSAGQLIYVRGGIYTLAAPSGYINMTTSGTSGNRIRLWAYPGETPVVDGINLTGAGDPAMVVNGASWWHLKQLEVKNAWGAGILLQGNGSNNIVERCDTHHNQRVATSGTAISIINGDNNLLLNNDSHHNGQYTAANGGSGCGCNSQGTGNIIRGNRCWRNNDNGIELFDGANVLVEDNWVWETGYDDSLTASNGDGVGFKLGGSAAGDGNHTVRRNVSWRNRVNGFDSNSANIAMTLHNNTGWENAQVGGSNFAFSDVGIAHVLRNNLAENPDTVSFAAAVIHDHNSWNGLTITAADFVSTDFTANTGSRKADGSLPDSNFVKLAVGSDCIDAGVDVGLPFNGAAPDVGAYES